MKNSLTLTALVALLVGATQAHGQSAIFTFSDGMADGWAASGFSGSPAATVQNIGGSNYIFGAAGSGSFQVLNVSAGADGSDFYNAMKAAAANPAGYNISYDYVINTAAFASNPGTFLQVGTFVNSGSGYYTQDFNSPYEVSLTGAQLASGQTFSGQVTLNMAAVGFNMPAADTFFRLGFIVNGTSGSAAGVDFNNISITAVPEPASLSLFGLAGAGLWLIRRRGSVRR